MKPILSLLFAFMLFTTTSFSQPSAKKEVTKDRKLIEKEGPAFDWEVFDTISIVSIDSIKPETLQGLWKAYNGFFKFGDFANTMKLTRPLTIEFTGDKVKRSVTSELEPFTILRNQITSNEGKDVGIINMITDRLLIITWKNGTNYTRYYYEK